jgi:hypothetical protein
LKAWIWPGSIEDKLRPATGFLDGLPRLGQLDLLDPVSREKCDLLPL